MGTVPGLDRALKLYDSDKIGERTQGSKSLHEIFSNRENLELFQERARVNNGAGWVSLFQVLFTVVLTEKKLVPKKTGGPAAEKRLAAAVSLVRFVAERSVHLLSRKPFMTLFTHMTTLLVGDRRIYERVAIDYAKALRALLSFPPHLEALDPAGWRTLMGVCWAALLGDRVSLDEDEMWGEGEVEEDDEEESGGSSKYAISASVATELVSLIPILLSSSRAPLISAPPSIEDTAIPQPSIGCRILLKINRYLHQLPAQATIPLEVLRSLNIVLGELELNHKDEFTAVSLRLFSQLVTAWTSRSKGDLSLRESALVALRIMLPYVTHNTVTDADSKEAIREAMGRLIDWIGKEAGSRGAVRPLDINSLRFDSTLAHKTSRGPFQLAGVMAGFGFDASQALNWAAIELYADCCYQTLDTYSPPSSLSQTQRRKRQRTESSLEKLLTLVSTGQLQTRELACQVVVFLLGKYWTTIQYDARAAVRSKLLELLDDADPGMQSWSFIGLACLATLDDKAQDDSHMRMLPGTPAALASRQRQQQPAWERLWTHAVRKSSVKGVTRAACHAANIVLTTGKVDQAQCVRDIHTFLKNVDIQGPASVSNASSAFLVSCLATVRADAGLYSANLEDKVLDWFSRTFLGESINSKSRMSSATPSNNLDLLSSICHFTSAGIADVSVVEHLPDCPIANRILQEAETAPIRDVILHGTIPQQQETEDTLQLVRTESQTETSQDSLTTLEGRARKLSGVLRTAVETVQEEWTTNERSTLITAERLRKGIDLVVLIFAFQATIQSNGYRPDSAGCLQPAAALLQLLLPHLRNFSDNIPHQHLVWRGFMPLYYRATFRHENWPIMLKPDVASGMRRDILSPTRYATHHTDEEEPGNSPRDKLLAIIWRRPEIQDVLGQVVETSKGVLETVRASTRLGNGATLNAMEDDDFGPILTADVDAMAQSSEAKEASRSTESLLKTLVDLRLRGPLLASPNYRPTKDISLLNFFLNAEGGRFVQLGFILCDAVMDGSLRLTVNAVDLILEQLWEKLNSYMFQRDGDLIRLAIVFLTRSIGLWLTPDSGLTENAIDLARSLVAKGESGKLSDWRGRLQLLVFIDEYLDFDPGYSVWTQFSDTEQADIIMGGDNQFTWGPLAYVLAATSDIDSRVRFRAMSSSAGIHYLPDLSAEQKSRAYFGVLSQQSSAVYNWDHYLTNLLWKANTCLASAQLRSATMFHLYEVFDFNERFMPYLLPGLEAVAQRLGLDSLKPLFQAHANVIVISQLQNNLLPLNLPCSLYGCASRKEFAQLALETVGPNLIAHHNNSWSLPFFSALCQAALVPEDQALERHLPFGAAIAVAQEVRSLDEPSPTPADINEVGTMTLAALPPPRERVTVERLLNSRIEFIIANLIGLADLSLSNTDLANVLTTMEKGDAGDIFLRLLANDAEAADYHAVLDPSVPDTTVLQAHAFFRQTFKNMNKRRMVFNGIVRLFYNVNDAYLVNEQRRYLRAIAMLVSLYASEFTHAAVLQQFLSNVVALLPKGDIGGVAMSMLEWGFDQVAKCTKQKPDLVDILVDLGSVRAKLQSIPHLQPVAERLDVWVATKAQSWMRDSTMETALETALVFWPPEWTANFPQGLEFQFDTVARIAERPRIRNPIALCRRLDKVINSKVEWQKDTFVSSTFWYLKKALTASQWDSQGAMAFLDLMYKTSGTVHAPSLSTIKGLSGHAQLLEHGRKYAKLPTLGLRVLVMGRLLQQTFTDDYRLRTTTFEVLQAALPILKVMLEETPTGVPLYLRDLIVYLVPNTSASPIQPVDIGVLTSESSGPAWVHKSRAHDSWAKELALMLGTLAAEDDVFYACLRPLLATHGNAAIELLPYLVQAVLTCGATTHPDDTAKRAEILTSHFTQILQFPMAAPETIEAVIRIILHLRHFQPPYGTGELAYNHWLNVDPIVLSEAAGKCGAYASSLLFLEMANDRDESGTALDLSASRVQKIMYDIYSNVEDPDGFYGIQNNDVMDSLLRRLDHEVQPVKSLGYNLANYEVTTGSSAPLVSSLQNLHDLGFHSFAGAFMKTKRREGATDSSSDPFFLELAWRMGDWDVPITQDLAETTPGRFYTALRAVHRERDRETARRVVDDTIHHEMTRLQKIGVERMTEIKAATINLLCLRDIARWVSVPFQAAIDHSDFKGELLANFDKLDESFDFANAERLLATRLSLVRSARARENRNLLGDLVSSQSEGLIGVETNCQLRLSYLARKEGNLQAAVNAVTAIRQLESGYLPADAAQDEFSHVLWAQGHHSLAIQHITDITDKLDEKKAGSRKALLLGRAAHWTALAKLKAAEEIRRSFREALDLAAGHGSSLREQAQIAHNFASWADNYYATLSRSPELERLKSFVTRKKEVFQQLDASLKSTPPGSPRAQEDMELEEERKAKYRMERELLRYLEYALQSYSSALAYCDDYDDSITRLCSLWLAHDTNEEANKKFTPHLEEISTHKFIVLAPQLAARLYRPKQPSAFNHLLNGLMRRLAREHPYHVLYQIVTLAAGATPPRASSRSKAAPSASLDGRSSAAAEIMERLHAEKDYPVAAAASVAMKHFADAAVNWSQFCHDNKDAARPGKEMHVPSNCALLQCRGLMIPIATVVPAVDLTLQYANLPTIDRYRSTFRAAGGIHRPAIMTVIDTLGKEHIQLFKAEDEVRQDAVMEQVFDMTNRLLSRDRKANLRKLLFRTYTVVPLYNKTGIIEFVGDTQAIGDWLKDAHMRYRKGIDVPADVVRKNLSVIQEKNHTSESLVSTYKEMMGKFQPVMRHFFTEKRREPLAWFSMRLNYARSVAVTSMVGYMVGLGDRHCSNILIDKKTGELVHIDFGIVFEEGRKLRIPEKVPFRLTNDIVDGLGITGVNGTFRQCAEHTLRVLRDSSDLILTVLEVFKHDPLYAWTGDPSKMRRAQGGGRFDPTAAQAHGQDKAERVLTRIRQKLGRELSVEYTVNMLIQEARDPQHLAKIYVGWQPWL